MDATSLLAELSVSPHDLATAIRADVGERTGCSASVGMGQYAHASAHTYKAHHKCAQHLRND